MGKKKLKKHPVYYDYMKPKEYKNKPVEKPEKQHLYDEEPNLHNNSAGLILAVILVVLALPLLWYFSQKPTPVPVTPPVVVTPIIPTPQPPQTTIPGYDSKGNVVEIPYNDPDNSGHHLRWKLENGTKHYFWRDSHGHRHWWPNKENK